MSLLSMICFTCFFIQFGIIDFSIQARCSNHVSIL
jgi:hypothetical protein